MIENCQKLKIQEITQKNIWEDFLMERANKTFLNSWNWGEFQKNMREKIWRMGIFNNEQLIGLVLVIKVSARRGNFLLTPHCPIIINSEIYNARALLEVLIKKLKNIAKKEKCCFIRISPIWERNKENIKIFKDLEFRDAPIQTHPEASWKLDIKPAENALLKSMRKTTRYLIKQAQKNKDIEIIQAQKIENLEIFNKLHKQVSKTQNFTPFSLKYLKNEFLAFNQDNSVSLFFGKYKGEVVAVSFIIFWSGIGFYHHAALSPKFRKIPVSYLLQWEAIKEAKKRGCGLYDFWGFVDNPKHPWYGPTLFKMGFSGYADKYVKTQDLVLSQRYWLNYIVEKIRKIKRRL
ncbi:MAG: peptidoglycan bridge formation glycyltransferase FemA/FemB family protein [Patescibacteria group bacterium]|nr:peptidoglycan bridge formation glycyltransferase FemA/FemB family protein [Patescibacteria group bacterium]